MVFSNEKCHVFGFNGIVLRFNETLIQMNADEKNNVSENNNRIDMIDDNHGSK